MRSRTARSPCHSHASGTAKALTKGFEHSIQIFKNVYINITKCIQFVAMQANTGRGGPSAERGTGRASPLYPPTAQLIHVRQVSLLEVSSKPPRGAVYFLGELLTLGTRTTEAQGWKRRSLTTNCGY